MHFVETITLSRVFSLVFNKKIMRNKYLYYVYLFPHLFCCLSDVSQGCDEDRLKWMFNMYDLDKTGLITERNVAYVIHSVYLLAGKVADEEELNAHARNVFKQTTTSYQCSKNNIKRRRFVIIIARHDINNVDDMRNGDGINQKHYTSTNTWEKLRED
ncbi:hypothetical protein HELRODRAFT_166042 [Helobdella robusta]|uniref:EF-hand domain-containing protein n=1 Tax=Helobdella robusta TaxID=6412 RepID=T1EXM7_HELRO|nr:hypothetical protein HELRODRAFT_166042 [Helobdella robusta]ESN90380.1 hypothetical protein HELRODRAFT_166042 [Helobdella robusta]